MSNEPLRGHTDTPLIVDLSERKALVTGGSRGIGRAIALRLAQAGADVCINYLRNRIQADETLEAIRALGRDALAVKANVAREDQVQGIFQSIRERWGRLDILISNASSGVLKPALEMTSKHWHWTMDINATALIPLARGAVDLMGKRGGKIVAVSSLGAQRAIPDYGAVGASKAALESLVRHLAIELGPRGINVNIVSAGVVDTDALKHFPMRETLIEQSLKKTPAGRLTSPDDVANVVLMLLSEFTAMVHGQTVVVDGGYSITA
jgi:enoyl-[acyl-carrier protein] reductase III